MRQLNKWTTGDCCFIVDNDSYLIYKLLGQEEEEFYVTAFWPVGELPTELNWEEFAVRTQCTAISSDQLNQGVWLLNQPITAQELGEVEQFKRIRAGKLAREAEFLRLMQAAKAAMETANWQEAIHLLTEAAPFYKLDHEIYVNRGKCAMQVGNRLAALNDIQYVLQNDPSHKEANELLKKLQE